MCDVAKNGTVCRSLLAKGKIGNPATLSPQSCERFEALQQQLIAPVRPDGKKETYELIRPYETRGAI
jgi:hypothetical protein